MSLLAAVLCLAASTAEVTAPTRPTEPTGGSSIAQLLDDELDDDMAALPLDVLEVYTAPPTKRPNEEPTSEQQAKRRQDSAAGATERAMEAASSDDSQQADSEFAEYEQYNTAELLRLPEWGGCAASSDLESAEVQREMRRRCRQHTTTAYRTRRHCCSLAHSLTHSPLCCVRHRMRVCSDSLLYDTVVWELPLGCAVRLGRLR